MRCHIGTRKILLGDMSSPFILAQLCFLKPRGAHTTPSQTHDTNEVHMPSLLVLQRSNQSGLLSAGWHGMWTSKSAGYEIWGLPEGTGCHQEPGSVPWVVHGLCLRGLWVLWAGWVSVGRGSPPEVPGLWHRTESPPSLPALQDWTWICSVNGEPLDMVPCTQTECPSIEAEPPDGQTQLACVPYSSTGTCTCLKLTLVVSTASFLLYFCFFTRCLFTLESLCSLFTIFRLSWYKARTGLQVSQLCRLY